MKLIAIDTCTETVSVSLYINGKNFNHFLKGINKSSSIILSLCDELLTKTKTKIMDLNAIIYTKGPGSFTGVRVCVAVAQGLSYGHNIPTIGISTLELMAFGAYLKYQNPKIAVALDARMNEIYWSLFDFSNEKINIIEDSLKKPAAVEKLSNDFIGVGNGFRVYEKILKSKTNIKDYYSEFYPKAENLIKITLRKYKSVSEIKSDKYLASALYLRNKVTS